MNKLEGKKICQNLPVQPGVYLFKSEPETILYVGKAINLKNRVKNYFCEKIVNKRILNLLDNTKKIEFIVTKTEIEALLLEAKLIKKYRPKYNVRLKDDKRYLCVGITNEQYPAVRLIRRPEKEASLLDWFGPFPTAQSIRQVLRLLRRVFPFRSCQKLPRSACLYYHLKLCPGMCLAKTPAYAQNIKNISLFLNGEISLLINELKTKMVASAKKLKFEQAEKFKNQIQMIEKLLLDFKRFPDEEKAAHQLKKLRQLLAYCQPDIPVIHRLEAFDIANLGRKIVVGAMVVFSEGEPERTSYRQFKLTGRFLGDSEAIKEILCRRLKHRKWSYPQLILVDGGKGQVTAAFSALEEAKLEKQIALIGLAKKEEKIVIPQIKHGRIFGWKIITGPREMITLQLLQFARDEAHRFAQRYYQHLYQKATLLSSEPK